MVWSGLAQGNEKDIIHNDGKNVSLLDPENDERETVKEPNYQWYEIFYNNNVHVLLDE